MASLFDDKSFDFDDIFKDDGTSDDTFSFGEPAKEEIPPEKEPVQEATVVKEEPEETVEIQVPEPEPESEPATEPEAQQEPKEQEKTDTPKTKPAAEAATETPEQEAEEKPTEEPSEQKTEAKDKEPEVKVEEEGGKKEKKTRKSREKKGKAETLTPPVISDNEIDKEFVESLLVTLSPEFADQKKKAIDMMNKIDIRQGMNQATIAMMYENNTLFQKYLMAIGDVYRNASRHLDEDLMAAVRAEAELAYEGTATDKKNAGILALRNYTNPRTGKKCNLLQYSAALHSAVEFCDSMEKTAKGFSIALSSMVKIL